MYRSQYFTDCKNNWDSRVWEDLVLEFLSATLTEMDEEKWTMGLGVKLMEQIPLCQSYPEERGMLYKCLAVTVCHTTDEQFINHQLDVMLSSMRHNSASESKVSPPQYDMFVGLPPDVAHKIILAHLIFKSQVMLHIFFSMRETLNNQSTFLLLFLLCYTFQLMDRAIIRQKVMKVELLCKNTLSVAQCLCLCWDWNLHIGENISSSSFFPVIGLVDCYNLLESLWRFLSWPSSFGDVVKLYRKYIMSWNC